MPEPLHPAVVHFPIVLAVVLPLVALGAIVAVRRGARPRAAWLPVVLLAAGLVGSGWLALETGEQDEEAVERIVAESAIHEHEEAAEVFVPLSVGVLLLALVGLAGGRAGSAGRYAVIFAALALVAQSYRVGHTGGELVYRYGAAGAFTTGERIDPDRAPEADDEDEDDEGRRSRRSSDRGEAAAQGAGRTR